MDDSTIKSTRPRLNYHIFSKYSYKTRLKFKKSKNILLFFSNCEKKYFDCSDYNNQIIKILTLFKSSDYNIIIKGHPRLEIPEVIKGHTDTIISSYIPAEFIEVKGFNFCFGINTNALCFFAKNTNLPTYSLIKLIPEGKTKKVQIITRFLKERSNNKISFVQDMKELETILRNV